MESFREKIPMLLAAVMAVAICGVLFYTLEFREAVYYTQVDNRKIEEIAATDNMKYEYTLAGYAENGKSRELKFKTSRKLREGAYLKLKVMAIVGVKHWEEVQPEALPDKVKAVYTN